MAAKTELQKHVEKCHKCVEKSPGNWDLCEEGHRLLRKEPIRQPFKVAVALRKHDQPKRPNIQPPKKRRSEL